MGKLKDFKVEEAQEFIGSYFTENELYLVIDLYNTYGLPKFGVASEIREKRPNQDLTLCTKAFNKMVGFSYIWVTKHGAINS